MKEGRAIEARKDGPYEGRTAELYERRKEGRTI
jgi:hypothetical protein